MGIATPEGISEPGTGEQAAMHRTGTALKRTAVQALPTMLGIIVLCFLLLHLVPGDAADVLAAENGSATLETMISLRQRFGLDQPMLTQLVSYLVNLAHLDLGYSVRFGMPVSQLVLERLPNTLLLMVSALSMALVIGITAGWVMAIFAGRWADRILQVVVLLFYSTPGFWVGLMAIVLFSVKLGWLPSNGNMTVGQPIAGFHLLADRAAHLVLPSLALSSFFIAVYARLTRAAMLEVQGQDFIRTAAAKGLHPVAVQVRHALRNALIPVTTVAGVHLGNLEAAATEPDPAKRRAEFLEFQQIVMRDAPDINIGVPRWVTIYNKRVLGHSITADGIEGNLAHAYIAG
jgi:peptide/nickel transport system permease protein